METRFLLRAAPKLLKLPACHVRHASSSTTKTSTQQANPIGDYYASILTSSSPPSSTPNAPSHPPSAASPSPSPPEPSILFSSRLSSPLERRNEIQKKSVFVAGVWVPPRPDEPDNCCMSGCVNCVWDRYRDELEEWAMKKQEANAALKKEGAMGKARKRRRKTSEGGEIAGTGLMLEEPEEGAEHTMVSMDDDGGGSEGNWGTGLETGWTGEELFKGVPVGIREFMRTEKKLKEKHAREGTSG